jgi:ParB family chromosome partitioning protein
LKQQQKSQSEEHKVADKRGGLGRGIGALIPTSEVPGERPIDVFFPAGGVSDANSQSGEVSNESNLVPVPGARFGHLDVDAITPNPKQPRSVYEPEAFAELVHSIRELGVLQPIVVRDLGERDGKPVYELIMGERRLRASKEAGLAKIPAVIRETADENMLRDALLENLHRSDLNPLEEASAYQQLLEDFGITQDELAERIGRSRPKITNTIRLLRLPASVQLKVAAGVLSAGHARAILALEFEAAMEAMADKVVKQGLSVRAVEELVAIAKPEGKRGKVSPGGIQDSLKGLADQVGDRFSTKAKISLGKGKGVLTIEFGSLADLYRILDEMGIERDQH